jgi:hypothetical protein
MMRCPGWKDVIHVGQLEADPLRLVGLDRRRVREAFPVAAAEDVERNRHLVPAHQRVGRIERGIHVDELDHEVAIGACRADAEVGERTPWTCTGAVSTGVS